MKFVLIICGLYFITTFTLGQNIHSGRVAIGYSGNFSAITNELGITYLASDNVAIEPVLGFNHVEMNNSNGTVIHGGLGLLFRLNRSIISPYLGLRLKLISLSGGDKVYQDWIGSAVFGGEYFISDWFSMGAEMRLNYVVTDDVFSPGYSISNAKIVETEQVISIRLYFN